MTIQNTANVFTANISSVTSWTARITAPGLVRTETFSAADYPDTAGEGDNAWVAARDALVDDLLAELADNKLYANLGTGVSTLLCDADPEEPVSLAFGLVTVALLPASAPESGYTVEYQMPEVILEDPSGIPIATFHSMDEIEEAEEGGVVYDEEAARATAAICAAALNAANFQTVVSPLYAKVRLHQFDRDTWQVLVTEAEAQEREFAAIATVQPDDDDNDKAEEAYTAAVNNARQRGEKLVALLGALTQ